MGYFNNTVDFEGYFINKLKDLQMAFEWTFFKASLKIYYKMNIDLHSDHFYYKKWNNNSLLLTDLSGSFNLQNCLPHTLNYIFETIKIR